MRVINATVLITAIIEKYKNGNFIDDRKMKVKIF